MLDTHLLVWVALRSPKLSARAKGLIDDETATLLFSAISIWEVAIKFARGKPDFEVNPQRLREGLLDNDFIELPLNSRHALEAGRLPVLHKDPFDRALAGQARVEGLTLLTSDKKLARYGDPIKRV